MSLATKYRPSEWEDMVEQNLTVQILKNICESGSLSNRNFLLTGASGVGKTTIARLMGNKLNDGVGEIIELDAASNSGVDAMREIIAQAQTYPLVGKLKVLIIDECHSISPQGWAALLKTVEEGPAKTVFFFCTTNPEKIPKTILSRIQQFQLSKISLSGIISRIKAIVEMENVEGAGITYDESGIAFIAKLANGGMRDALTMLDKVLVYSKSITSETVSTGLGLSNYDDYFSLLSSIAKRDNEAITNLVDQIYNSGVNFMKWFEDFHSFTMNIVKFILLHDITRTTIPGHYEEKLSKYTIKHFNVCLKLANVLLQINQDLKTTSYQQEVVLTRLCTVIK